MVTQAKPRLAEPAKGWDWYWVCVVAWIAMIGAWAAATDTLGDPRFCLRAGSILVAAFPVAYYLRFSEVPAWRVRLTALGAAVVLGAVEVLRVLLPQLPWMVGSLGGAYRFLTIGFLWVMAFRAFTLRGERDMAETTILVGSILLLVLVNNPGVVAVAATAASLLGCVALLAASHDAAWTPASLRPRLLEARARRTTRSANSWPTLYIIGLLAAVLAAQGFRSFDITDSLTRQIQIRFARALATRMMLPYVDYVTAEPRVYMFLPGPSGNRPLFEVRSTTSENWRLAAYTTYQTQFWSGTTVPHTKLGVGLRQKGYWTLPAVAGSGEGKPGKLVALTVTARMPIGGAAPSILWPRYMSVPRGRLRPRVGVNGALWLSGFLRPGDSYTLEALEPTAGTAPGKLSPELKAACLQLPEDFPQRIRVLAESLARGEATPGQKVAAFVSYLGANYHYDVSPPEPPRGVDPTAFFLFDSNRGYCVQFASALTLMCRCIGIPARFVSGFLQGEAEAGSDVFVVRARDAHAWTEAFLPKQGWTDFDATPPQPLTPGELAAKTWSNIVDSFGSGLVAAARWFVAHLAGGLLLLALAAAIVLGLRWWQWRRLVVVRLAGADPARQVQWAYRQMLRWLARAGEAKPAATTPVEHLRSLGERWRDARPPALALAGLYYRAVYSRHPLTDAESSRAVAAAEAVRDHWLAMRKKSRQAAGGGAAATPGRRAPRHRRERR